MIAQILERRGFTYLVIDQNRRVVELLRGRGIVAVYGDAANPLLLERVNLARARICMITIPDPLATRQVAEHVRRINPRLHIVARTHSPEEWTFLRDGRVDEAVLGERELAIEMVSYALRRFGVSMAEISAITQALRGRG